MKRENKYTYLYVLQGNYSYGFEDLTASENRKEIKNDLRDYRENEGGNYRIIERRELNPKYKPVSHYEKLKKSNGGYDSVHGLGIYAKYSSGLEYCTTCKYFE